MAQAYSGPLPQPTPETKPFWEAAKRHILLFQRCNACATAFFYPRPLCPHCLARDVAWVEACGRGRLHTFVISHHPPRNFPIPAPYVIGVVELAEGVRLLSQIVGVAPDPAQLRCDMPVEVVFEDLTDQIALPKFRPAEA
jgi:hypothetical protein